MNKRITILAMLLVGVIGLVGCASTPPATPDANQPQAALKTAQPVAPPTGCAELRARGGAC